MEIILSLSCSSENNWGNRRVDLRIRFLNEVRQGSDHVCWAKCCLCCWTPDSEVGMTADSGPDSTMPQHSPAAAGRERAPHPFPLVSLAPGSE